MRRVEPIEWFGLLTTLAAVATALSGESASARGSRAAGPNNPCKRLASYYRELGDEGTADDLDVLAESPTPTVLDQCSYELGMSQEAGRAVASAAKRRPGLARR